MSGRVDGVIERVRWKLGSRDEANQLVSYDRLKRMVEIHAIDVCTEVGSGRQSQTVALTSGNDEATLTTTNTQYMQVSYVVDADGRPLQFVSWDYMLGLKANPQTSNRPRAYAINESTAQAVTLKFHPTPNVAQNVTVYANVLPIFPSDAGAVPSSGGGLTDTAGSFLIPLDETGVRGLECRICAEIVAFTPAERLAEFGLSKDVGPMWKAQGDKLVQECKNKLRRQRRTSMIELWRGD